MKKEQNNEGIQSRREFFKKAAKTALPILGAIALANIPILTKAAPATDCDWSCSYSCKGGCDTNCQSQCAQSGCGTTCAGKCIGTCYSMCTDSCHRSSR